MEPIVNITDAVPGTVRIPRTDLRPTDVVFDVFGGRHPLRKVLQWKNHTTGFREDGGTFRLYDDDTITVARANPA